MSPVKICMIAVLGLSVTLILRQWKSDLLPLIRIGFTVLFAAALLVAAAPLFKFIHSIGQIGGLSEYMETLFKALGIAVLTEICAGICRESGEGGIAGGVELTGKAEILLLSLPMLTELLSTARELLSMGG